MIRLEEINERNWRQEFTAKPSQRGYAAGYMETLAKAYACREAHSRALLVLHEDAPVGFCMYYERPYFAAYQLSQLTIDAAYQGQGFGREAVMQLLCRMRQDGQYPKARLGCIAGNEAALHLYTALGFAEIDREDDEIIMELTL